MSRVTRSKEEELEKLHEEKPLAVVIEASSGIGLKLSRIFARNSFALMIVAEDEGIESAAAQVLRGV